MLLDSNFLNFIVYTDSTDRARIIFTDGKSIVYNDDGSITVKNHFKLRGGAIGHCKNELIVGKEDLLIYGVPSSMRFGAALDNDWTFEMCQQAISQFLESLGLEDLRQGGDEEYLNKSLGSPILFRDFENGVFLVFQGKLSSSYTNSVALKHVNTYAVTDGWDAIVVDTNGKITQKFKNPYKENDYDALELTPKYIDIALID